MNFWTLFKIQLRMLHGCYRNQNNRPVSLLSEKDTPQFTGELTCSGQNTIALLTFQSIVH